MHMWKNNIHVPSCICQVSANPIFNSNFGCFQLQVFSLLEQEHDSIKSSTYNIICTYIFGVSTNIVGSFRVVSTFCEPFFDRSTISGGMVVNPTAKTTTAENPRLETMNNVTFFYRRLVFDLK